MNPVNALSLSFLRPIYKCLKYNKHEMVLLEISYSGMAGHREYYVVINFSEVIYLLRDKAKPKSIVRWTAIKEPDWFIAAKGLVPDKNGELTYGSY